MSITLANLILLINLILHYEFNLRKVLLITQAIPHGIKIIFKIDFFLKNRF